MTERIHHTNPLTRKRLAGVALAVAIFLGTATPLFAAGHYLTPGRPDGIALLAPPPEPGSEEQTADLNSVRTVFKGRTPAEEAKAKHDSTIAFTLFGSAIGPFFQLDKLPKTDALMKEVKAEIGDIINIPKNHWKRTRPYVLDPTLALGAPEDSYSYPSGHSTRGTVYAMVLAEVFPEHRQEILRVGLDIGWDRVLIGKHFPTDVRAGRVLGQAIMRELMASPAFQQDLAEAKEEAQAAQHQKSAASGQN